MLQQQQQHQIHIIQVVPVPTTLLLCVCILSLTTPLLFSIPSTIITTVQSFTFGKTTRIAASSFFRQQQYQRQHQRQHCSSSSSSPTKTTTIMMTEMKMNVKHQKEDVNNYTKEEDDEQKPKTSNNNTNTNTNTSKSKPLFTIGIIADIQYAPIPDGFSYTGTPRYYRHSLIATKNAFQTFTNYNKRTTNNSNSNSAVDDNDNDNDNKNDDTSTTRTRTGVDIVINLGDIVDGKCQDTNSAGGILIKEKAIQLVVDDPNQTKESKRIAKEMEYLLNNPGMLSLKQVQQAMLSYAKTGRKILHTYGNHCLYNLNRTQLRKQLGIPFFIEESKSGFSSSSSSSSTTIMKTTKAKAEAEATTSTTTNIVQEDDDDNDDSDDDDGDLVGYYSYVYPPPPSTTTTTTNPDEGHNNNDNHSIKFILLDGYDIALMKRSNTKSKKYKLAEDILKKENPINYKANNMNSPEGLVGLQKRFVGFNGAIGDQQLIWLRDELQQSRNCSKKNNQKVIIVCHQCIHPDSSNPVCLLWNYDQVLTILRSFSDIVISAFSGHAHKGGYVRDPISGIHFRIIEAVLESKPTISTYGILEMYYKNNQNNQNQSDENDNDNTQNENTQNENCIVLKGYGDCQSAIYDFNHCYNNNNINEWKNSNATNFETDTDTDTVPCSSRLLVDSRLV